MTTLVRFLTSSIGRKMLMGASGLLLFAFLVVHLSGNFLVFAGRDPFNHYSETLVSNPLIYVAELALLGLFVLHFVTGILVTVANRRARPVGYAVKRRAGGASHKSLASTTMILSGIFLLAFVPLHLWTFKFGPHYPSPTDPAVRDMHRLVLEEFHRPVEVAWYVGAMVIIGFHLWHAFASGLESLGVGDSTALRRIGQILAVAITTGFIVIPLAVFFWDGAGMILDGQVPAGALDAKWSNHKDHLQLVNPANRRKHTVIVVGTGLAGASAAASLGELGYNVLAFTILDSPRRSHSIAAQGGINAAKNYKNDGDSVFRLFYDTVKGGDFRAREANVHRLAEVSVKIIDQCVAQGVPFAREYGGMLDNRSFGGAQLSRTFYARGQTGQQLLIGAYGALMRQVDAGTVKLFARREMLDLVVIDGRARGIVTRNLVTGELERFAGDAVLLATGGYGNLYYLSTNAGNSNVTAAWRCAKRGAYFANPCFVQIHPTCIPASGEYQSKLTLMSESLRNDGRVWVPKQGGDPRAAQDVPESERSYFLEERYPSFGNLVPRDVAARNCKTVCEAGQGVGPTGYAVYLDFADAIRRLGAPVIRERYGNLFQMYERIVGDDPYAVPMRIYPAVHYTMGGLWVDYNLMSNVPGLFVLGEANFSDHGANRLGASALMQGLADGYFIIPYTLANYIAGTSPKGVTTDHDAFKEAANAVQTRIDHVLRVRGDTTVTQHHRRLGQTMWEKCSISREAQGMEAARTAVRAQRDEFWQNVRVPGEPSNLNKSLELALRVADFLEFGELVAIDALARDESCGSHFREEHQTPEGEAQRDDEHFAHVAAWEWHGSSRPPTLHTEPLHFESVALAQRNYR